MNKRYLHLGAALAVAVALGACGGGDDHATADQATNSGVPSSAQQSVASLVTFLTGLIGQSSDGSEPIALGDAVLPTSDTTEPTALN